MLRSDPVAVAARGHAAARRAVRRARARRPGTPTRGSSSTRQRRRSRRPARLARGGQRVAADEAALLVQADGEAEPGLVGRGLRRDVGAPHAVALLQAHRVDRAVAAGRAGRARARPPTARSHSARPNSAGQYSSQPSSPTNVIRWAKTGTAPTRDLARAQERERLVERSSSVSGCRISRARRAPEAEAGARAGHVLGDRPTRRGGRWRRIQARSRRPNAVPVTTPEATPRPRASRSGRPRCRRASLSSWV